jgi:aspartyl-tRNA synthetase
VIEGMQDWKRSHDLGELRLANVGERVTVMGWVHRRRDHGGLIFVDLRDREGLTQIVFYPELSPEAHENAHQIRTEFVVAVRGEMARRPEETENLSLPTGQVEVRATELRILNRAKTPVFPIEEDTGAGEDLRLKYRYLDLRRPSLQRNLGVRHRAAMATRRFLDEQGFLEVETPVLTRSTPEGARDFLVPSRLSTGQFYALPQSPQLFKQLLMVAGLDRYYQIVKCFRDEDLRADRQPEFTQIDLEMSFVSPEDVMGVVEPMIARIWGEILGTELTLPFPRLPYADALTRYGTDAPDTRYGLELADVSPAVAQSDFKVFAATVAKSGVVKAFNAKGAGDALSRKEIDDLADFVTPFGAKGLAWIRIQAGGEWQSPIAKFLGDDARSGLTAALQPEPGGEPVPGSTAVSPGPATRPRGRRPLGLLLGHRFPPARVERGGEAPRGAPSSFYQPPCRGRVETRWVPPRGPRPSVRPGTQRHRGGRRIDSSTRGTAPVEGVRGPVDRAGGGARQIRVLAGCPDLRRPPPRRHRPRV